MEFKKDPIPVILRKTDMSNPEGCWNWQGATTGHPICAYGVIGFEKTRWKAHRLMFTRCKGEIPPGKHVMHTCDNPLCVNPAHLTLGTHADNMRDREVKGRHNAPRGSVHGRSKLTEDLVREARRRVAAGEKRTVLAKEFGVHPVVLGYAVSRKTWARVE